MKTALFLILTTWISLTSAFARIGDTAQQCQERYGAPYKSTSEFAYYRKSGFILMISYFEGKVDSITYRKIEENALGKGVELSDNEIEQILKLNAGDKTWKKRQIISMDREWLTEDGELFGFYKTFDNYLSVSTKGYNERAFAAKKAKENKSLEGF